MWRNTTLSRVNVQSPAAGGSSETRAFRFIALFLRLWALTENRNPQKTAVLMLHLLGTTFCRGLIWMFGGCGGLRGLKRGEKCEKRLHFSPCVSGLSLLSLSPPTLITHHHSRQILHMCRHASSVCVCVCQGVAWSSSPVLLPPQRHTEGERSPCVVWTVCVFTFPDWSRWKTSCGFSVWTCWLPVKNLKQLISERCHQFKGAADLILFLRLRPLWGQQNVFVQRCCGGVAGSPSGSDGFRVLLGFQWLWTWVHKFTRFSKHFSLFNKCFLRFQRRLGVFKWGVRKRSFKLCVTLRSWLWTYGMFLKGHFRRL